jgi:hypothetical protein
MNLANLLLLTIPGAAPFVSQEWGDIKGRVVFVGEKIPENPKVNVFTDKEHCLSKGPIYENKLVIDPKTKGVRWVLVWLTPVKGFRNVKKDSIPIRPSVKQPKEVEIRGPRCEFEPRMLAMREGTALVFRRDNKVVHNPKLCHADLAFPGGLFLTDRDLTIDSLKAPRSIPIATGTCTIHPWMRCYVGVFHHPYFAVTDAQGRFEIKDAPAGRWRLVLWQETSGYIPFRSKDDVGILIDVRPKKTTDVGVVKFFEPKD